MALSRPPRAYVKTTGGYPAIVDLDVAAPRERLSAVVDLHRSQAHAPRDARVRLVLDGEADANWLSRLEGWPPLDGIRNVSPADTDTDTDTDTRRAGSSSRAHAVDSSGTRPEPVSVMARISSVSYPLNTAQ